MIIALQQLSNNLFLKQIITAPTHKDGNTLDFIFTNNINLIHNHEVIPTLLSTSHHALIEIATTYKTNIKTAEEKRDKPHSPFDALNFMDDNIDWESINNNLKEYVWSDKLEGLSPEEEFDHLLDICLKISQKYTPARKGLANKDTTSHIPKERKILMRKRRRKSKQILKTFSPTKKARLKQELVAIEKALQISYKMSTEIKESKALQAIQKNPKYFYSYAK